MKLDLSYHLDSLHFFMLQNGSEPDFRAKALCKKQMSIYVNYLPILAYFQVESIPFFGCHLKVKIIAASRIEACTVLS